MPGNKIYCIVPPSSVSFSSKPLFLHCILAWKDHLDTSFDLWPTYGHSFFPPTTKNMAKPTSNLVILPSDEDTSEDDEFANFLFTNEVTQVNEIDESSNSSTAEYTQLLSLSVTIKCKYYQTTSKHSHYVNIWLNNLKKNLNSNILYNSSNS